jgi:hypothetical protein
MTRCYVCNAEPQDGCQAIDGEIAECPRPSLPVEAAPKMPDDYWLHVRRCDCDYCAWERQQPTETKE